MLACLYVSIRVPVMASVFITIHKESVHSSNQLRNLSFFHGHGGIGTLHTNAKATIDWGAPFLDTMDEGNGSTWNCLEPWDKPQNHMPKSCTSETYSTESTEEIIELVEQLVGSISRWRWLHYVHQPLEAYFAKVLHPDNLQNNMTTNLFKFGNYFWQGHISLPDNFKSWYMK